MPTVRQWGVEVDVDIEVDVEEFYNDCSDKEKEELAKYLIEDGFIPGQSNQVGEDNINDIMYKEALNKLYSRRISLSLEEEEFLMNLANKF